ncbi:MAG: FHA domain-containing protein [Lachnospiraceae bacterium]|nr:FHA domain-containing protein [Lachnospiraceae bacterium]
MEVEFRQDLCKRTMVAHRNNSGKNSFREKMLLKNSIRGIARVNVQYLNGDSFYSYDMGSCQTLKNVFEGTPMSYKELKALLSGLSSASHELEKYLLDVKDLMTDPEQVFWDLEKEEPCFCYYPENPGKGEDFVALAQFLIDAIDKEDEEASALAYAYFDRVCEGMLLPDDILRKNTSEDKENRKTDTEKEKTLQQSEPLTLSELWCDDGDDNYYLEESGGKTGDEEKKGNPFLLLLAFIPAITAALVYGFIFMDPGNMAMLGLSDGDYIRAGIGVTVFSGVFIAAGVYFWNRHKKEEEDRKLDMDSLNSDIHEEEYRFDELEERSLEKTSLRDEDYDATVLLTDLPAKNKRSPVLSGRINGIEKTYEIDKSPYMIGKLKSKADGVISDSKVSRIHACIREDRGRYYLSDLNSTNGTCINDRKLSHNETAELSDGDLVRFASVSMTFRLA